MTYSPTMAQQYKAYATAKMTVGKVRQIVMLYDGVLRFVQQAVDAINKQDYETRYNILCKASEVISGLQNSLDFEQGGDIAHLLYDYYASIDARLLTVHRTNDIRTCEQVMKELRMMRGAWDEIDRAQSAGTRAREDVPAVMPKNESAGVGVSA